MRKPDKFTTEDVIELGKKLLEWVDSEEGKKSMMWVDWYYNKHGLFRCDWENLMKREEFRMFYTVARQKLAQNMMLNKQIHNAYGMRYLGHYDDQLHEFEESVKDKDAARKKSDTLNLEHFAQALGGLDSLLNKLGDIQTSKNKEVEEHRISIQDKGGQESSQDL